MQSITHTYYLSHEITFIFIYFLFFLNFKFILHGFGNNFDSTNGVSLGVGLTLSLTHVR